MASETICVSENKPVFLIFKSKFAHHTIVLHSRHLQYLLYLQNILLYTSQTRHDIHKKSASLHFAQYLRFIFIFINIPLPFHSFVFKICKKTIILYFIPTTIVQLALTVYNFTIFFCKIVGSHIKRDDDLYIASFTRLFMTVFFNLTLVDI